MQEDLVRGYRNFLLGSIKTYFLGRSIIQDEIDFYTQKELKDGLVFFLCVFEKIDVKLLKTISYEDEASFNKYVTLSKKGEATLTQKGEGLKKHIEEKLSVHAAMLEFNGIKPQYLGKITTMTKRFEKFWQMIVTFSRKKPIEAMTESQTAKLRSAKFLEDVDVLEDQEQEAM